MKINFNPIHKITFKSNQKEEQPKAIKIPTYIDSLNEDQYTQAIQKITQVLKSQALKSSNHIENKQSNNLFLTKINKLNRSKKASLDMEQIKSIILPSKGDKKLRSFENSHKKFILDKYQQESKDSFIEGNSTITTAPTGTGKTLIAEYCIEDALKNGKKIIYLSPLKALSNEKFINFSELFAKYIDDEYISSDNVGIITGDVVINPDAPLIIMTTEIYRNMVNSGDEESIKETFKDFSGVIFDEFQYFNDPERGTVWEEAIMQTPEHMRLLLLSATASNAEKIQEWLSKLNPTIKTNLIKVPESERYVPLKEYVYGHSIDGLRIEPVYDNIINLNKLKSGTSDRAKETITELEKLFGGQNYLEILSQFKDKRGVINAEKFSRQLAETKNIKPEKAQQIAYILSDIKSRSTRDNAKLSFPSRIPPTVPLVKILNEKNMTPALLFIFSKKRCKKEMDETAKKLGSLLTPEESKRVLDVVNEAKEKNIYLGNDFESNYLPKLLMGYAVHHAGMLPSYKSIVEKLSREGLIKVCFATETLLAGINMPFKTTVFTSLEKFDGKRNIELPTISYKQGAGRAGRRGIDDIGNVIVCPTSKYEFERFKEIMESDDTEIKSAFNLSYASLLQDNVLKNLDSFIKKSFLMYQSGSFDKVKQQIADKLNYLEEKGYVKQTDEKYEITKKGETARKIYGINQILLCELISDPKYTKDLTPEELACCMTMFADINDDKPRETFEDDMAQTAQKLSSIIDLAKQIQKEQNRRGIDSKIKMSTNLAPAIYQFANAPNQDRNKCIQLWNEIFNELKSQYVIMYEGDLLRVFNGTIDLLKTITEVSDDPELIEKAQLAINSLQKPPLTDILKYELNVK